VGLTDADRDRLDACLAVAPTILENLFFAWLLGFSSWESYADELLITDLLGPGDEPDDFAGCL
jgi:hypothetical protein